MNGKITYHQQVSYCGKPRCRRCREGIGHGPYWYAYQTINGRTVRTYVGKEPPAELQATGEDAQESSSTDLSNVVVRLYVLGQLRLEQRNGQHWQAVKDAVLQHQRVRALLSCLISSPGRKLGREQVMEMLWPDVDFETASHRLDRAVHSLRQLFEPGRSRPATSSLLLTEHQTILLADQAQLWIDADAFDALLAQAHASNDPGQTEQFLEEAMMLYCGDFLPDEYSFDWIQTRREALRRSWIGLLLELADLRIARELLPGAIDTLDRLLAIDPANEAAVQRLMVLLAQSGRRGEAIRTYQRFVDVLKQQYNIAPLLETRTLYETVQKGDDPTPGQGTRKQLIMVGVPLAGTLGDAGTLPPRTSAQITAAAQPADHEGQPYVQVGRSHQSPLVGREHELKVLHQLLRTSEQATRIRLAGQKKALTPMTPDMQRSPQCVLLMGDVGIGKTRLAEETGREAKRRGWAVAWSRAYAQESSVPYRLWTEVLRKAMTQGLWQRQEIASHAPIYQPLRTLLPELHDLLPQGAATSTTPPEQEQIRLWEATRSLLTIISESTPLFIVLDDLQWADGSSCELLSYLVRQLRGHPVMIVGTCRDIELPANHPLRSVLIDLQREQAVELLTIERLTDEQIRALLSHLPEPVVEHISTRAAGNPFFAEELARTISAELTTAGQEEAGRAEPRLFASIETAELPDTISAVLDLRMSRITSACQRLLTKAAVLGGSFEFNSLYAMETGSGTTDEDTVLDLLEEALQAGMLTEEGSGTRITYHFWHPVLVSHLYEGLSAARRASLHRRAAELLRQTYAGREEEGAAAIAYHLINGGAESAQIARYAELAGDRAYALSAYPEAERHYRLAVEHLGTLRTDASAEERLRLAYLLERLGECTRVQGKFAQARRYYEQALELHKQQQTFASGSNLQEEAQIQALLWCEIGRTWYDTGNNAQSQQCYQYAEEVLREAGVVSGLAWARLRFQQSYTYWQEGNYDEARETAQEALKLFEEALSQERKQSVRSSLRLTEMKRILEGDPVDLGRTHTLLGLISNSIGRSADALTHLHTGLMLFEQHDRQREIAIVCCTLSDIHLKKAEYTLAQADLRRSLSLAEIVGDVSLMAIVFFNLGELATRLGKLNEAEAFYKRSITLAEQINDQVYLSLWNAALALLLQNQGKNSEAVACIRQSMAIGRAMNIAPCIGLTLVTIGNMRIMQALTCEEESAGSFQKSPRSATSMRTHLLLRARATLQHAITFEGIEVETKTEAELALAQVSFLQGELKTAQQQVLQIMEKTSRYELIWHLARSHRLLGSILAAGGQHDEADSYFEQAIRTFHDKEMRLEWARALQSYGVALLERASVGGEGYQQGWSHLQEARQVFHECNATLDLQAVELILFRYTSHTLQTPLARRKSAKKGR